MERLTRAIDVDAPPGAVWPWLGQLREAPYSYDWLDNWGRRSPRAVNHALGEIAAGQPILSIFEVVAVTPDREFTAAIHRDGPRKLFGDVATTYTVAPRGADGSRIVVRLVIAQRSGPLALANAGLAVGDLVMMRKQLRTLKQLAEHDRVSR